MTAAATAEMYVSNEFRHRRGLRYKGAFQVLLTLVRPPPCLAAKICAEASATAGPAGGDAEDPPNFAQWTSAARMASYAALDWRW